jgi:S-adenosylmethionine synthetase
MGHPDKVADQISDAVLDAVLAHDPKGRVACEVMVTKGLIVIAGEITAAATVPYEQIARKVAADIGYTSEAVGLDAGTAEVRIAIQRQSPDIARGVDREADLGAGDQGLMFGYAVDETPSYMPLALTLAHDIVRSCAQMRLDGEIEGLRPDAKSQVSILYDGDEPLRVTSVVLSTQHDERWSDDQEGLAKSVTEMVLRPVLDHLWDDATVVHVNPTGRFESGGPAADTGLTGRKIIVDTYGGRARHGGGAFSGKDPSKVDRSASYMARYVAKNVVASGLARECEVRLGYAIGVPEPVAVTVDCAGGATVSQEVLEDAVRQVFALSPAGIIAALQLQQPIYLPTARHGHFGREPGEEGQGTFPWERTDRVDDLLSAAGA